MNDDSGRAASDPGPADPGPTDPGPASATDEALDPPAASKASDADPTEPIPTHPAAQTPPNLPPRPMTDTSARRRSIAVPMWVALALGAVLLFGIGFLGGYAVGDDDSHGRGGDLSARDRHSSMHSDDSGRSFHNPGLMPGGPRPQIPRGPGGPDRGNGESPVRPQPGNPSGAFLGVSVQDSADPRGATIMRVVASGPAAEAGLKTGDVITAIDDTPVRNAAALTTAVRSRRPGAELTVAYTRDAKNDTADVTLGERGDLPTQ